MKARKSNVCMKAKAGKRVLTGGVRSEVILGGESVSFHLHVAETRVAEIRTSQDCHSTQSLVLYHSEGNRLETLNSPNLGSIRGFYLTGTNSTIALQLLNKNTHTCTIFVSNLVSETQKTFSGSQWKHVVP